MSLSRDIAPVLPYLRRYARSLAGSQKGGDAYVVETLETIIEDPASFPRELGARVGVYRVFTTLWSSSSMGSDKRPAAADDGVPNSAVEHLASLTPRPRQAFLLRTVEGFSSSEVASILDVDLDTVTNYLAQAGREIAKCVATDVLVIEDEALIAAELSMLVRDLGHSVIGIARTRDEARELALHKKPGLVLADIQLADGSSGIDAVNDILQSTSAPIIFITAYPERLLTGLRPEPTFLISKPYKADALRATISQSLFFGQRISGGV
jgi:DNA-directed RNA polymerase specialized sigma24 family protein/CheY-like chemotaxis protein